MTNDHAADRAGTDAPGPVRWSPMAMAALMLSVLPFVSAVAPVLGAAALVRMRSRPNLRGKPLAWAGIVLGLVTTGATAGMGWMIAQGAKAITERPGEALRAAWSGDAEGFRARMSGAAHEATADRIAAWIEPLRSRFGGFEGLELDFARKAPAPGDPMPEREMTAPYVARFRGPAGDASVPATVVFEKPTGGSAQDVRIRRFEFDLPGGTRIVLPEDGTRQQPGTGSSAERP
jgi:hypothetical protein